MVKLQGDGPLVMVDDNPADVMLARVCLEDSTLRERELLGFDSGAAFLAHLDGVARGEAPMPAIALLDINMPRMNGFELLEAVRALPACRELPLIAMLTNSDNPADVDRALALGAQAYQRKPASVDEYVAFFDSLVP